MQGVLNQVESNIDIFVFGKCRKENSSHFPGDSHLMSLNISFSFLLSRLYIIYFE